MQNAGLTFNDTTLQSLNIILSGFTPTQISTFNFRSSNTISILGSVSKWSSSQVIYQKNILNKNYNSKIT